MNIILVDHRFRPRHITSDYELHHGWYALAHKLNDYHDVYMLDEQLCEDFATDEDLVLGSNTSNIDCDIIIQTNSLQFTLMTTKLKPNDYVDSDLHIESSIYRDKKILYQHKEDKPLFDHFDIDAYFMMLPLDYKMESDISKSDKLISLCNGNYKSLVDILSSILDAPINDVGSIYEEADNLNRYHAKHDITEMAISFCIINLHFHNDNALGISAYLSAIAGTPCIGLPSTMQEIFYPELTVSYIHEIPALYTKLKDSNYYKDTVDYAQSQLEFNLDSIMEVILE